MGGPGGGGEGDRVEGRTDGHIDGRSEDRFEQRVAARVARMRRARRAGQRSPLFGLGMLGLVGWSISIPVLAGTLAGAYLDRRAGTGVRWTLSLMVLGFVVGGLNAWNWIERTRTESDLEDGLAGDAPGGGESLGGRTGGEPGNAGNVGNGGHGGKREGDGNT